MEKSMEKLSLRSAPVPSQTRGPKVCSITREGTDKVQIIGFPDGFLDLFRIALQSSWEQGIQAEGIYGCSYEFKLRGTPWVAWHNADVLTSRLVVGIMRFMLSQGWALQLEMTASLYAAGRMDSWFFRKVQPERHADLCGVRFTSDKIKVFDAKPEVSQTIEKAVQNHWHLGLQKVQLNRYADVEIKMFGYPFQATHKETTYTNAFMMHLMEELSASCSDQDLDSEKDPQSAVYYTTLHVNDFLHKLMYSVVKCQPKSSCLTDLRCQERKRQLPETRHGI